MSLPEIDFQYPSWPASVSTTLFIAITVLVFRYYQMLPFSKAENLSGHKDDIEIIPPEFSRLGESLAKALPDSVIKPLQGTAFKKAVDVYHAQQECEVTPGCVIRPRTVHELATAIKIIKTQYDELQTSNGGYEVSGLFAVRSGGHSPVHGAASTKGGILIDMSLFSRVECGDGQVIIGSGARWKDVYQVLDKKNLAVAGGRSSSVGVGGLILGGGLSYFSPRCGLVCSNVISYEVVLADGSIVTASETSYPDLWRALKGGSNNFGIVTNFTCPTFANGKIWSGVVYRPSSQDMKTIKGFHEFVNRPSDNTDTGYDKYAAGPIIVFAYFQSIGSPVSSCILAHTKDRDTYDHKEKWPTCFENSAFAKPYRFWSTCKTRSLTAATDELEDSCPRGDRQITATTTIQNDLSTLIASYEAFKNTIAAFKKTKANVKGLLFTFIMQPIHPEWVRMGDANPLGLHEGFDKPLVIICLSVAWKRKKDDVLMDKLTRELIGTVEGIAKSKGTGHRWRYLNYCAGWQKPLQGYGEENFNFLRQISRKYDPEGLFQRGCSGGFKLGLDDNRPKANN